MLLSLAWICPSLMAPFHIYHAFLRVFFPLCRVLSLVRSFNVQCSWLLLPWTMIMCEQGIYIHFIITNYDYYYYDIICLDIFFLPFQLAYEWTFITFDGIRFSESIFYRLQAAVEWPERNYACFIIMLIYGIHIFFFTLWGHIFIVVSPRIGNDNVQTSLLFYFFFSQPMLLLSRVSESVCVCVATGDNARNAIGKRRWRI